MSTRLAVKSASLSEFFSAFWTKPFYDSYWYKGAYPQPAARVNVQGVVGAVRKEGRRYITRAVSSW
jgi:hypothetical protein